MIEENIYKFVFRVIAVTLLMAGGVFAILIFQLWQKADKNLIRARIFLNERFLRKSWFYMFIGITFFAIDQIIVFIFGYYTEISIIGEALKAIFVSMVDIILIDYYKLLKSCVQ